jgi:hypothetical protein
MPVALWLIDLIDRMCKVMTDKNPMPDFLNAAFEDDSVSARGESRDSLFLSAEVAAAGWAAPLTVRVRNLSAGGLLAESQHSVAVGTIVRIKFANTSVVGARCVWSGDKRFGVAFDHPIDPQAVRRKTGSRTDDLPATLIGMTLHTTKYKKPLRPI